MGWFLTITNPPKEKPMGNPAETPTERVIRELRKRASEKRTCAHEARQEAAQHKGKADDAHKEASGLIDQALDLEAAATFLCRRVPPREQNRAAAGPAPGTAEREEPSVDVNGIGWAVKQMLDGRCLRRRSWFGKSYIYHVKAEGEVHALTMVFMADGSRMPWRSSDPDLFATDWELVD